jgi:hypothetical protein
MTFIKSYISFYHIPPQKYQKSSMISIQAEQLSPRVKIQMPIFFHLNESYCFCIGLLWV